MYQQFCFDAFMAMFWVMKSLKNEPLVVEDVSLTLNNLTTEFQIETGASMRRCASGFWSKDASDFLDRMNDGGLSKNNILNKAGLRFVIKEIITPEAMKNPVVYGEVSKIIGFKLPEDFSVEIT